MVHPLVHCGEIYNGVVESEWFLKMVEQWVGSRRFTTKQALLESCIWDDGSLHIEADIALSAID
jgi:hypothetical protein